MCLNSISFNYNYITQIIREILLEVLNQFLQS